MAIKHKFTCSESDLDFLTVDSDIESGQILIETEHEVNDEFGYTKGYFYLDVATAIKLSKTIRTHINLVKGI